MPVTMPGINSEAPPQSTQTFHNLTTPRTQLYKAKNKLFLNIFYDLLVCVLSIKYNIYVPGAIVLPNN